MQLLTSRELLGSPREIARLPNGCVLVLRAGADGAFLEAVDAALATVWTVPVANDSRGLVVSVGDRVWLLDSLGASAFDQDGARKGRVDLPVPKGMVAAAYTLIGDDLIVAYDHGHGRVCPPVVQRVGRDGVLGWSTTLPVGSVAFEGVVQMSADERWKARPMDPWLPKTWLSASDTLLVSGDAVLARFHEMPRSGIGFGYALSLADGTLRFTTKMGPLSEAATLGNGAFLVGYQGYGAFETLRYERDGRGSMRWASHGHYLVTGDDIRVIELENVLPSKMHIARLLPDGSVVRGAWLEGYYTSRPHLRSDGTILFCRAGALVMARDLAIERRLAIASADEDLLSTRIVGDDESAYFALTPIRLGDAKPRLVHVIDRTGC
jgi:hypothetical protein